ncbi:MAG: histidine--tRNA ligase [Chloroflexi bacterium]|jgi:histidyl-tRNA synthetase|nr:histidine--tRNA ligase [Chloroflexota bacterium]
MFKSIRGTKDILPNDQKYWEYFKNHAFDLANIFGFKRIDTPTFESTDLFLRGIGLGTDIVTKETYSFVDRGENNITLQPEGTASVCRSYIENGMFNQPQPIKLYYFTSIFRYERPQSGRLREHHQFGIETIGSHDPELDAEIISFAWTLLKKIGLSNINLSINSIGDITDRKQFITALQKYYKDSGWAKNNCADCNKRILTNALRILDCKNANCKNQINNSPNIMDFLSEKNLKHFENVKKYLELAEIDYHINTNLVRGLDYYTHTVFEIISDKDKRQNAIVGGGRYNGLIEKIGGNKTPGVGFGMGVERVINEIINNEISLPQNEKKSILFTYLTDISKSKAIKFNLIARKNNIKSELALSSRSLKANMRYGNNLKFSTIVIIGDPKEKLNYITYKELNTGAQKDITEKEFIDLMNQNK